MSFLEQKERVESMKKNLSVILVGLLILLSGCGVTVSKVESTTELTTEVTDFTSQSETSVTKASSTTSSTASVKTTTAKNITSASKSTTPKTTSQKTTSKIKKVTCTIEISCQTILDNIDKLRPEKKPFLPKDGYILTETTVSVKEGSSVFDVLTAVCKQNTCPDKCAYCRQSGIQLEYNDNNSFGSQYIRGIHQIYEKDCGTQSGWMYSINNTVPNYGLNNYIVSNGDKIKILYTCDLGEDIGNNYIS